MTIEKFAKAVDEELSKRAMRCSTKAAFQAAWVCMPVSEYAVRRGLPVARAVDLLADCGAEISRYSFERMLKSYREGRGARFRASDGYIYLRIEDIETNIGELETNIQDEPQEGPDGPADSPVPDSRDMPTGAVPDSLGAAEAQTADEAEKARKEARKERARINAGGGEGIVRTAPKLDLTEEERTQRVIETMEKNFGG
ncbi:MAG: hypothetical protein ACQEXG_11080 [Pseudomonadota bacterium]